MVYFCPCTAVGAIKYIIERYGNRADEYEDTEDTLFSTEWMIHEFRRTFNKIVGGIGDEVVMDQSEAIDNDSEEKYLAEVRELLGDGVISPRERRLLEKIRIQLGISEARAAELENSVSSSGLTEGEQEFLCEYKEIISEGEISARDQRFLYKLQMTNGISDQRAKEIMEMA